MEDWEDLTIWDGKQQQNNITKKLAMRRNQQNTLT